MANVSLNFSILYILDHLGIYTIPGFLQDFWQMPIAEHLGGVWLPSDQTTRQFGGIPGYRTTGSVYDRRGFATSKKNCLQTCTVFVRFFPNKNQKGLKSGDCACFMSSLSHIQ